ncbi:MAG: FMN-binding domain protein [Glaciihabitans sp.]|jgi:uncharacterized protein with FMN-binding domain|nr:FMN-binding domain protein [Glaciihabitans sp.]MDQ1571722.1 hypothetical protein [Actinomycetota bacterium]
MRTRVVVGSVLASAAVLGIAWGIGSASPTITGTSTTGKLTDGTYAGSSVQTRFGTVQVQITVSSGKITDVTALHLTDAEQRSVDISNQAAPILRSEVLAAQSASVNVVSGATYTTEGYLTSLQAALDKASA